MWVRKSNQQVTRERSRFWLCFRGPVLWFVTVIAVAIALTARGVRLNSRDTVPTMARRRGSFLCDLSFLAFLPSTRLRSVSHTSRYVPSNAIHVRFW